jgi:hypothetical protein
MGRLSLLAALVLSLAVSGCALKPVAPAVPQADVAIGAGDRTDCQAIYGTAFHSEAERDWFTKNCTQWPYFNPTPGPQAAAPVGNYVPTQTCDQIRGKPYTSEGQHQWYLANCIGTPPGAPDQVTAPASQPSQPQVVAGPDRTNCGEITGTPYRSPNERQWYLANCVPPPQPVAPAPSQAVVVPAGGSAQGQQILVVPNPPAPAVPPAGR